MRKALQCFRRTTRLYLVNVSSSARKSEDSHSALNLNRILKIATLFYIEAAFPARALKDFLVFQDGIHHE